jgi:queuine tRNA-ribosyltransferase
VSFAFDVVGHDGAARLGRLDTAHGRIDTPAFMPVGTRGAVKGVTPQELEQAGAQILLANLYHLTLRPGIDAVEAVGGLHAFTGWRRPLITDSGGYQVYSLSDRRRLDDDGVTFRSHLDGAPVRFTPAGVVAAQERLGVDLAMVLDDCPVWPIDEPGAARSLERTLEWARRSLDARRRSGATALFAIAQGSVFRRLRERAAAGLAGLDFDGYAIGGVSVGEPVAERRAVVEWTAPCLPEDRPRYLMGVGTPDDILHAVAQGVDLFDCVLPARNGRHGILYTRAGTVRIKNAAFRDDSRPLDPECSCPVCARVPRALLHHLIRSGEITGAVYATLHNLRYFLDFMADLRQAIASCRLADRARSRAFSTADGNRTESLVAPAPGSAASGGPDEHRP